MAVVKNPLSPVEHPGGEGVANELFELGLESFIVSYPTVLQSTHKLIIAIERGIVAYLV